MVALQDKLSSLFRRTRGFTPDGVQELIGELRKALLVADVALPVVRSLTQAWQTALASIDPTDADAVFDAVEAELVAALGEPYALPATGPLVIVLCGLQGAGKTTTAGKLARHLVAQGRRTLLVGADLARPAAVRQLELVASRAGAGFFSAGHDPLDVATRGVAAATAGGWDVCILDTAGRTGVDQTLLGELAAIQTMVDASGVPSIGLLVIDAQVGQDGLAVAQAFATAASLDAVVVSKSDGDARGGVALSVRHMLGLPVAFVGTGEGVADLDVFDPARLAGRLVGRGDVDALVERVADAVGPQHVADLERVADDGFSFDDYLRYVDVVQEMGTGGGLSRLLPGSAARAARDDLDIGNARRLKGIGASMTALERADTSLVLKSKTRVFRIARGAGVEPQQVRGVIEQYHKTAATIGRLPKRLQRRITNTDGR